MSSRRSCLPDTAGQLHIGTHGDQDRMHKTMQDQDLCGKGGGSEAPPLAKKLFEVDNS